MKKKSPSEPAFISLRVLLGLFGAFIALALASSHAIGTPTSTPPCYPNGTPSATAQWPGAVTPSPIPTPMLWTDFYFKVPVLPPKPVLVFRGCDERCTVGRNLTQLWPAGATYHLLAQEIRGDCTVAPFLGDMLFKFDQDDGHTFLDLIAAQSWEQGATTRIGMEGWSNAGIVDYLAAVNAGPSLRGIQTHFATGDLLNYGLFNGGVQHVEIPYPADLPQTPSQISWKDYVGLGIWNKYLIYPCQAAKANVAGLHVGGWYDVFGQGILDTYSRMQDAVGNGAVTKQKLVIGPWIHGGNGSTAVGELPFPLSNSTDPRATEYTNDWQSGVFSNSWTAWNALPAVRVYLLNATTGSEWMSFDTWPPKGVPFSYYFTSTGGIGGLSGTPQQTLGQLTFTSDPSSPCPTRGGINNLESCVSPSPVPVPVPCGPMDQRLIEARTDVAVFTSTPFPSPGPSHAIVGRIHAEVWIQTTLPDVDVFVRMTDVYPDGRSMLMAQGIQRAAYRDGNVCRLPALTNTPTRVHVDLGSTGFWVKPLHKLRLIVSASGGPNEAGNPNLPFVGGYSVNPQNGDEYLGGFGHQPGVGSINVLAGPGQQSILVVSVPGGNTLQPDERPNTQPCGGTVPCP